LGNPKKKLFLADCGVGDIVDCGVEDIVDGWSL
jgi:hypothetical protein